MLKNFINGGWQETLAKNTVDIIDPSTEELLERCPLSTYDDVNTAVLAAAEAFKKWRKTPVMERVQFLFKIKYLLEENATDLAQTITKEHGKTILESRAEVRRAIQMIDTACGMPSLMLGSAGEDVAMGIDSVMYRQPMGVFAALTPFNFPLMVPCWFWPFAIASGNTFILKPSERVSLTSVKLFNLLSKAGLPAGVMNLVLGGKDVANALIEHHEVRGISFVGSTPVAKLVYESASAHKKRVQALGGAKNFMVVLPDAEQDDAVKICVESITGCAGQRCLAGSVIIAVGEGYEGLVSATLKTAKALRVGNGMNPETDMGPLISSASVDRISMLIQSAVDEGAKLLLDGRSQKGAGYFMGPSVITDVKPSMRIAKEEIFGPVICIGQAKDLNDAIAWINSSPYANTASLFTDSASAARKFYYEAHPAMLGLNIGVPAPMAYFSFGGSKDSFFGDVKVHGSESVQFFTDTKVIVQRFHKGSSIW